MSDYPYALDWVAVECESCDWDFEAEFEGELAIVALIPDETGEFDMLYRPGVKNIDEGPLFDDFASAQEWAEYRVMEGTL